MKNIAKCVALLLLSSAFVAAQDKPLYQQVNKFNVGGDGFWDYVTFDPQGDRVFIAHGSTIDVVGAADGKLQGQIPANGAHGVALVHDKNRGFSTNGRAGTVTVFDLKTLKPTGEVKAGENPDAVIYDPNSKKVIVMNGRSKDLSIIDPDSLKVDATIPLGGKLEFAAADSARVYVNVEDTGEIAAVDSKTWKPVARWKLEGCEEPSGLAIDTKTSHVFTVCGNKKMLVVDTKTGKTVATIDTGAGTDGAGFDAGLGYAFASNGEGTLSVVGKDKSGEYKLLGNVTTQRGARTMAVDPKSHKVFLPTAELGPPAEGQRRPTIKPGTFTLLVYAPAK